MKVGDLVNWVYYDHDGIIGLIVRHDPHHGDCFTVLVGGDEVVIHHKYLEVLSESR